MFGRRRGSHGADTWAVPGGKLDWMEDFAVCAAREVREETSLEVVKIRPAGWFTNDLFTADDKHYVTLVMLADYGDGEAEVREPEKCSGWDWFAWDDLPRPLFSPIQKAIDQGFDPRRV